MKFFGIVIIVLIVFLACVILWAFFLLRKVIIKFKKNLTGDYDEETFKRMSDKYYRGDGEGPKFDKNYFKGSGSKRTGGYAYTGTSGQSGQEKKNQRTTTTVEGTTIIDDRSQGERKKKIFGKDEGEYIDFVEE